MGCDMVVALPPATGGNHTLFGANLHLSAGASLGVTQVPGRTYALGEALPTKFLQIPQVRQTFSVLAVQSQGSWGYWHGINEHRVAVSCSSWQSRFHRETPGLLGPDLVRLTLERAHSAGHALEVLTDLIVRHGQGSFPGSPEGAEGDHVFLVADPQEAFAVEAAGPAWAAQEIRQVRAAGDVGVIRQDWFRLAPGLADQAIAKGWWAEDGSKVDFISALCESPMGRASALRRWGRATLLLEQQNGHLDGACVRRLLADHYDGTHYEVDPLDGPAPVTPLCQHASHNLATATAASSVMHLPTEPMATPVFWLALGSPCLSVHFPLFLEADLPAAFEGAPGELWSRTQQLAKYLGADPRRWLGIRETFARLQTRFEQDVEEFLGEAAALHLQNRHDEQRRLASSLMQSHVERFEECVHLFLGEGLTTTLLASAATP